MIDAIAANTTSSTTTGVTMQIASNAPDQYVANYTVVVSIADGEEFTSDQSITINAPALDWGYFQVEDSMGDNNGRIDPGETFLINIPFTNVGHAPKLRDNYYADHQWWRSSPEPHNQRL
jgi:hypothetical protein